MSHLANDKIFDQLRDLYDVEERLLAKKEQLAKNRFDAECQLMELEIQLEELDKEIKKLRYDIF
jgi:hypothetical protein